MDDAIDGGLLATLVPDGKTLASLAFWVFMAAIAYSLVTKGRRGWGWYTVGLLVAGVAAGCYALFTVRWLRWPGNRRGKTNLQRNELSWDILNGVEKPAASGSK